MSDTICICCGHPDRHDSHYLYPGCDAKVFDSGGDSAPCGCNEYVPVVQTKECPRCEGKGVVDISKPEAMNEAQMALLFQQHFTVPMHRCFLCFGSGLLNAKVVVPTDSTP